MRKRLLHICTNYACFLGIQPHLPVSEAAFPCGGNNDLGSDQRCRTGDNQSADVD